MKKRDPRVGDTVVFNNIGGYCGNSYEGGLKLGLPYRIVNFLDQNIYKFQANLIDSDGVQVCVVLGDEYAYYYDFVNQVEDEIY